MAGVLVDLRQKWRQCHGRSGGSVKAEVAAVSFQEWW